MIESPYQPSPDRYDDGMVYRRAGRSGVLLPAFSLGMWHNFGSGQAFSNVQRMAHYAFDRGITHFDLANNYGPAYGTAEENFGRLMERSFRQLGIAQIPHGEPRPEPAPHETRLCRHLLFPPPRPRDAP